MRIKSYRLLSQVIFLGLSVIGIVGLAKTGLIFPYFFCNASPGAVCVCPIWAMEHASIIIQLDVREALAMFFYLFGFLGIVGIMVGRTFCGWACPIGFLQDTVKYFKGKLKLPLNRLFGMLAFGIIFIGTVFVFPNMVTGYLGTLGVALVALALYGLLTELDSMIVTISIAFLFLISLILIYLYLWDVPGLREVYFFVAMVQFFVCLLVILKKYLFSTQRVIRDTKLYHKNPYYKIKYVILLLIPITSYLFLDKWFTNIDPVGGLTAGVPVLFYESEMWNVSFLLWVKFILIGLLFWLIILVTRGFCRFICPVGALMSPTNKISVQDIKYYPENCTKCMKCIKACPMKINVTKINRDMECIRCARCVEVCKDDAVHMTVMNNVIR
jgi:polyferredoxin